MFERLREKGFQIVILSHAEALLTAEAVEGGAD